MIDSQGYRSNVGIVIADGCGDVLWGKRIQQSDSWQFPQGGIDQGETPKDALYRELYEEVGLSEHQVSHVAETRDWLRYKIPEHMIRKNQKPRCIGQKQKWFLLKLEAGLEDVNFDCGDKAEFSSCRWVSYWYPVSNVVNFKQNVYRKALKELSSAHCRLVSSEAVMDTD